MSQTRNEALRALIETELARPANTAARNVADAILAAHPGQVRAILFYGSCRRSDQPEGVLDFYVMVDRYRNYHKSFFRSLMNTLLPPDVSFMRTGPAAEIAAKVTVISLDQFTRRMRPGAIDTTLWARFTQPSTLLFAADAAAKQQLVAALMQAARTAYGWAKSCTPATAQSSIFWTQTFGLTYGAELRVERGNRPQLIYENDRDYYDGVFNALALDLPPALTANRYGAWRLRRYAGKILSVLRLCKAAFTFEGGVDYLLWKVERHSGVAVPLKPWQRRHPILAAPQLLYRLYRQGAIR